MRQNAGIGRRAAVACVTCLVLANAASSGVGEGDLPIADFEGPDYGSWQATGEAFGPGPADGTLPHQMHVSGYQGAGLVNSFFGGDGATGTLTSPPFVIERRYINFLIGGGKYPGATCMDLLVNGEVARTATGPNDRPGGTERLEWQWWDVADLEGATAVLRIVDNRTEGWGHINVDHIFQSNEQAAKETSMKFTAEKRYLNLPVKNGATMRLVRLLAGDTVLREFEIELADAEPDFWVFVDLSDFQGQELTVWVKMLDKESKGFELIHQGDAIEGAETLYRELLRPQFHFTSQRGWNNDPNGLVFYAGEYHLFYQHNPYGWRWGNMHWGHAVSTDLVHWRELGDALYPDRLGTVFSGSAVVDVTNSAGFQTGAEKTLVCMYTSAGGTSEASQGQPFTQSIAYSNDRGRSWTPYAQNPVLPHVIGANRDPKVIWNERTGRWIMALYLDKSDYALFASPDLKAWTRLCDIEVPGCSECPDIFELPVDGDAAKTRWVFWGANGFYRLGTFDGERFEQDAETFGLYAGGDAYAAQSWSGIPAEDGRRIQIAWLRRDLPGMPFNQEMTFPVALTLRTTADGVRLCAEPVKELEALHGTQYSWKDETLVAGENLLSDISGDLFDIRAEFLVGDAPEFGFVVRGIPVTYNVAKQELSCDGKAAALKAQDGRIRLRLLVDRASIEVFANDGGFYLPVGVLPGENNHSLAVQSSGGKTALVSMEVFELRSAWE